MMEVMTTILYIQKVREGKGLTITQTAKRAGLSYQGYRYIETGQRRPSVTTAKRLSEVLGIPWTEFFREDEATAAPDHLTARPSNPGTRKR